MEINEIQNLNLDKSELSNLFPFYLILSDDLKIESWGSSMAKLFPMMKCGDDFTSNWVVLRPLIDTQKEGYFNILLNKLIVISEKTRIDLKFKGQFEYIKAQNKFLFLGSPWFNDTEELIENKLLISDFALHDSMTDLLHVLKNNEIANTELTEIIHKVNQQKKILERDQKALIRKEIMLQAIAEATDELLSNENLLEAIQISLALIGSAIDIDRICIFENYTDKQGIKYATLKFDWNEDSSAKQKKIDEFNDLFLEKFDDLLVNLQSKNQFETTISDLEDHNTVKKIMHASGIKSTLLIPIFIKEHFWGFIGFNDITEERKWSNDEHSLLRSFTNSISSAIDRSETAKEVYKMALFSLENPDPVIRIDTNGELVLRNKASEKLTHLEIDGINRTDTILFKYLSKVLNPQNRQMVFEGKCDDFYYQTTASLSENNDSINIYFSNITKQKEAEKTILESNEQLTLFQTLINNSSDAVQVSYENGQLLYINNVASENLGIVTENCHKYYVKDFETIFQDDKSWSRHVEKLKKVNFLTLEGENTNQITGRKFPVEVTVKYIKIGGLGFVVANSRDVTERKRNENKLRLQEEKYRNIIANMNLGLLEVDLEDKIDFCNQSFTELSGYGIEELKGNKATELFVHKDYVELIGKKNNVRKRGKSDSYELIIRNKRGEARWWLVSVAPNYNDKGEIVGSIGIHLDITEQKRLEKDLENALRSAKIAAEAKESFLANMSHEIRTPLNGIIGMIRELSKEDLSVKQQSYLESASKASKHLLSVINNILDFSKIEAGELKLDKHQFRLQDVINDVNKILGSQATEKGLLLGVNIDKNVIDAFVGDAARIRQILINIAGNAIKFTEKGFVNIICNVLSKTKYHQKIEIKISDSGIGMDEAYLKKIFTKFQQEDISSSRKYGGSGLGMVITKELIDLMGGEIRIDSHKGKGTDVYVILTLPIGDINKVEKVTKLVDTKKLENKSILLVEDNEMNRLVAINTLLPYHLNIVEAENGAEALEVLKKQQFDLILMDLQMPIMGGLEATKIIRNELKIKTPIIALSANAFKSEIEKCIAAGMDNYVIKPFEEKELLEVINKEIGSKKIVKFTNDKDDNAPSIIEIKQIYDLTKLKEVSRGNQDFIIKMLNLFVDLVPKSIADFQKALANDDVETINRVAHRLKPSLDNLNIKVIYDEIRALENFDSANDSLENLSVLTNRVILVLELAVDAIKNTELKV